MLFTQVFPLFMLLFFYKFYYVSRQNSHRTIFHIILSYVILGESTLALRRSGSSCAHASRVSTEYGISNSIYTHTRMSWLPVTWKVISVLRQERGCIILHVRHVTYIGLSDMTVCTEQWYPGHVRTQWLNCTDFGTLRTTTHIIAKQCFDQSNWRTHHGSEKILIIFLQNTLCLTLQSFGKTRKCVNRLLCAKDARKTMRFDLRKITIDILTLC